MTRRLRPDEESLWARVAELTQPLHRPRVAPHLPRIWPDVRDPGPSLPQPTGGTGMAPAAATLDGLWDRKIRTGDVQVDRVVDLHGYSQERAYDLLSSALLRAARDRVRVMLVITGKGKTGAPWPKQEGILRAALPQWLETPALRPFIAALRQAHPRHGGAGAWYVILRRVRA